MPLTPKPKEENSEATEAAIQAVIHKGLASPDERTPAEDTEKQVVIFVPRTLLSTVDALVKQVRPKTSRRAWIVEAIREKAERDRDIESIL